ncbi:MAG: hypothetical protein ACK4NY_19970 [Spirosomataceae bacterium]
MAELLELKSRIHQKIDEINDEKKLLHIFRESMIEEFEDIDVWDELSDEQRIKLEKSLKESESKEDLVDNEEVFEKYKKWLTK